MLWFSKVGKLELVFIGLTSIAQQNNIKPIVEKVEALTRPVIIPKPIWILRLSVTVKVELWLSNNC